MIIVSVTYPAIAGSTFDLDYYRTKHMVLVRERWGAAGMTEAKLLFGTGTPGGGGAAYHMVALLSVRLAGGLRPGRQAARQGDHGRYRELHRCQASRAVQRGAELTTDYAGSPTPQFAVHTPTPIPSVNAVILTGPGTTSQRAATSR